MYEEVYTTQSILKRDGKAEEKWSKETPFMWACTQYTEF